MDSKRKSLLGSAAWSMVSVLWPAAMTIVITPVVIDALGAERYGLFLLLITLSYMFDIANFGLGDATIRYVSQYAAKEDISGVNRVLGATLSVFACTGLAVGLVGCLFAAPIVGLFNVPDDATTVAVDGFRIVCITFLFGTVGGTFMNTINALERFDISSRVNILASTVYNIALVVVVYQGGGVVEMLWLTFFRVIAIMLTSHVIARRLLVGIRLWPAPTRAGLREVFGYGVFSFLSQVVSMAGAHIDRLLLGALFDLKDVSYLGVPKQLLDRGTSLIGAASRALFPRFSSFEQPDQMGQLYLHASWALQCLSLVIFVPTAVLMHDLLSLWIGPEFAEASAFTAQLIAGCFAIRGGFGVYQEFLKGSDRIKLLTMIFFCTTLVSVIVAVPLLQHFGLVGAGYRVWVMVWTGFVIMTVVWRRFFQGALPDILWVILEPLMVAGMLTMVMFWARGFLGPPSWLGTIGLWCVYGAVLGGSLLAVNIVCHGKRGPGATVMGIIKKGQARES